MDFLMLLCLVVIVAQTVALDNGLALTPPMGFLSWQRFRCIIDCAADPNNCISEKLYMDMADRMAADGYRELGYVYVNIDDCWSTMERDNVTNRLVADPIRFPSGIKALADYVHARGLKLGIYGDVGSHTCGGYPGSQYNIELDAQTFADWEVDSLKFDGCNCDSSLFDTLYPAMTEALNKTGRPMLYICEWPLYMSNPNYTQIAKYCNAWRNYDDIQDSWGSVLSIIEFYGANQGNFTQAAGPGGFNDPDMIIIGNPGLSISEQQVQMAMWAIFAAPLFVSSDLRDIATESRNLILNVGAVAINQDPLGIMGKRIFKISHVEVWARPVLPQGSYAVAVINISGGGNTLPVTFSLLDINPQQTAGRYLVTDVFTGQAIGNYSYNDNVSYWIDTSSVIFRKYTYSL